MTTATTSPYLMADGTDARELVGAPGNLVQYRVSGACAFWGVAEYVTASGWIGIRQPGGRLDEAPARLCIVDPT